ncbi:MAG TPA: HAMP domain-containing sensor histidine kinase [Ktedonobacterales bacterium]|nr:HAMP domain-containing sensor histidine kinase [Ktedonobacterales bacterium]
MRRSSIGKRWITILAVLSALAVPALVVSLRPSSAEATRVGVCLAISGLTSIALAMGARWITERRRTESVHAQLSVPLVLVALVISVNVILLARLLFSSRQDVQLLVAFVAFGVAVALALSSPIAGNITRAIARIEGGAKRITAGEYGFRIAEDGHGAVHELAGLTHLINQMGGFLEDALRERQAAEAHRLRLVTAVSHDLRTPVSSIHAMVEAISDGVVTDPVTLDRYHQTLLAEVWRLTALMEELFELTWLESGAVALQRQQARMVDLLSDAVEAVCERATQAQVSLSSHIESTIPPLSLDAERIARVLGSVLQNAIRYASPGGTVQLRAGVLSSEHGSEDVLVRVIDTGCGIAADDLPLIFEPTYRADGSRQRRAPCGNLATESATRGGPTSDDLEVGLGLSIAARIVELHGGRIWAVSPLPPDIRAQVAESGLDTRSASSGTMLCFTLPIPRSPETTLPDSPQR